MAIKITRKNYGQTIVSGKQIILDNSGGSIQTDTNNGKTISSISGGKSAGEVNYDLNGVAYRRNGVAPDGSRAGDWKAKPNTNVDGVI